MERGVPSRRQFTPGSPTLSLAAPIALARASGLYAAPIWAGRKALEGEVHNDRTPPTHIPERSGLPLDIFGRGFPEGAGPFRAGQFGLRHCDT